MATATDREIIAVLILKRVLLEGNPKLSEFLSWIADRIVNKYGESENIDFVQAIRRYSKLFNEIEETLNAK